MKFLYHVFVPVMIGVDISIGLYGLLLEAV